MTEKNIERFDKYFKTATIVFSVNAKDLKYDESVHNRIEYNEFQIIEVSVLTNKIKYFELLSFAKDIVQCISYPTVLVLKYGNSHYRFFAFEIKKGTLNDYKSIVINTKCTAWVWYEDKKLKKYDKATLHNMLCYFYKSKDIYALCLNLMDLFEKHYKAHLNDIKKLKIDYYYNGHSFIQDKINEQRYEDSVMCKKTKKKITLRRNSICSPIQL